MTGDPEGETSHHGPDLSGVVKELGVWSPKGLVAVIDTSVLVAARTTMAGELSPSRQVVASAGVLYDSFTSPEILQEVEGVLARPRFGYSVAETQGWLEVFLRHSRQTAVFWFPRTGISRRDETSGGGSSFNPNRSGDY